MTKPDHEAAKRWASNVPDKDPDGTQPLERADMNLLRCYLDAIARAEAAELKIEVVHSALAAGLADRSGGGMTVAPSELGSCPVSALRFLERILKP